MQDRIPTEAWPPDYRKVYLERHWRLAKLRENVAGAKAFYAAHPVEFVEHWGVTYDPRNAGSGLPTTLPFVLFRRQREFIEFLYAYLLARESALIEKSRDMGATWGCVGFSVWVWLYFEGSSTGWGSRERDLVDKLGDPDSIFEKMRIFTLGLPQELLPAGFDRNVHMSFMRFINPENGATITGDIGDNIGRGGRKLLFFKDESAYYEHPEAIEAALGDNTTVQVDISSVHGTGNVFNRRREAGVDWDPAVGVVKGRVGVFVMDWRQHPMKTTEWYEARRAKAVSEGLLHLFAQEVDRDYAAAIEGVLIPSVWVRSAIDAHLVLGIEASGAWSAALDVADGGGDSNALTKRQGIVLRTAEEWGERDVGVTTRRAVDSCRSVPGPIRVQYDCIGVGAGVKSEANRLADDDLMPEGIMLVAWDAASRVLNPEGRVVPDDRNSPKNKDFFANLKAQGWWSLRGRFERTHRAVRSKAPDASEDERRFTWDADELISIDGKMPLLLKIVKELSQPTYRPNGAMKMMVDKTPDGTRSPNIADSIMMNYWPARAAFGVTVSAEAKVKMASLGRMTGGRVQFKRRMGY